MPALTQEDDAELNGRRTPPGRRATRVLIADDCPVSRRLYVTLLELHGFQARAVEDGGAAIRAATSGEVFDVILMDIHMPCCGGVEAAGKLRERGYEGLIYAFTGVFRGELEQSREVEAFDDCVPKPLSQEQIIDFLQKLKAAPPDADGTPVAKDSESCLAPKLARSTAGP